MHLSVASALLLNPSFIHASEGPAVYQRLLPATAWVRTRTQGIGSGWIVDAKRRWLVTNLHVVGDQDRVEVFFVDRKDGQPIVERQYYLENQKSLHEAGRAVHGKVVLRREMSDLALIELEKLPDKASDLPLATVMPRLGEHVHSLGNRQDADALWIYAAGVVRQRGQLDDGYFWRGKKLGAGVPCLIVQSPIHPGDSGGPLVNDRGEVVGVISGGRWQAPLAAIAIQVSEVRLLLAAAEKAPPPLPKHEAAPLATSIDATLLAATVWVRPAATEGRGAGWLVDKEKRIILTTSTAAGASDLVDVIFPRLLDGRVVAEFSAYPDRIGLRQSDHLVRGLVLARDVKRDLALVELESVPKTAAALKLAAKEPAVAERIHSISHPSGIELLWLYSAGIVRQRATIELRPASMDEPRKTRTLLLQLPHQAGSSGGPVINGSGEAVGLLAAKEGTQQQLAYAVEAAELRSFIDSVRPLFTPKAAAEFQRRGRYLAAHGMQSAALAALSRAAELAPNDLAIRCEVVDALIRAGRKKEIEERLKSLTPPSGSAPECVARALLLLGKRAEAIAWCETILKGDRKNAVAYFVRGALRQGKEALADLDEAIFFAPELVDAYRWRAVVYEREQDDDRAIADWSRAIELDPYAPEPVRRRAAVYLRKREPKRAVADFERLIELEPTNADSYRGLAGAWLAQGDETKAIVGFVAALRWRGRLRKAILEEVIEQGHELARRWPDDPAKKSGWYEQTLKAIRPIVEPETGAKIGLLLASRKKEWDDKTWGDELARRIRALEP